MQQMTGRGRYHDRAVDFSDHRPPRDKEHAFYEPVTNELTPRKQVGRESRTVWLCRNAVITTPAVGDRPA